VIDLCDIAFSAHTYIY